MTHFHLQVIQICKRIAFIFAIISFSLCPSYSTKFGHIDNSSIAIDYSKIDKDIVLKNADESFAMAMVETDIERQKAYVLNAKAQYNIVALADKKNLHAVTMLARLYDFSGEDRYAKAYFSQGIGINYKDPLLNYYFGDFYYRRNNYKQALKYYKKAFEFGLNENSKNLEKMAVIYEKFGDLQKASIYYKKMFLKNPSSEEIPDKIREIESIKYQNTNYYKGQ
ncbi:tetratricopeptide repeat protein [bacterium]|nr:tetratricopeptide repeat protein [bacterium]